MMLEEEEEEEEEERECRLQHFKQFENPISSCNISVTDKKIHCNIFPFENLRTNLYLGFPLLYPQLDLAYPPG